MQRARNVHDQNEQTLQARSIINGKSWECTWPKCTDFTSKEHHQWKELGMYMAKMNRLHKQGASSMQRARNVHDQNEQTLQARSIINGKSWECTWPK